MAFNVVVVQPAQGSVCSHLEAQVKVIQCNAPQTFSNRHTARLLLAVESIRETGTATKSCLVRVENGAITAHSGALLKQRRWLVGSFQTVLIVLVVNRL
ncbi:hypothetical protein GQ600_7873 [Phytophthora cactorum]|nr:hypothetical protein GQ600_7873 [Phytophthora cactorum]